MFLIAYPFGAIPNAVRVNGGVDGDLNRYLTAFIFRHLKHKRVTFISSGAAAIQDYLII